MKPAQMPRFFSLTLTLLLTLALPHFSLAASSKKKSPPTSSKKKSPPTSSTRKSPSPPPPPVTFPLDPVFSSPPTISAGSAILLDAATGQVLLEINPDQRRPVASTQKLLTALIVAEDGDLDEIIRVVESDTWVEPSMLYIKPGNRYSRRDFLNILLVHSMNDVARALARDNAGSVEQFADKMNAKATALGMRNTHFVNPNGLPATSQFSTARDMSKVALSAYRNRTIREMVRQKSLLWTYNDGRTRVFETTNKVLKAYPYCNGMKTGYTEAAGRCLISSASRAGRHVIAVVLGDTRNISVDSYRLLAYGLSL